ncbi:MAG: glycoside hydrolase family 9 protein, partial [Chitinispirillales bacterium]|nr:glycoside hydrolase family 9 protein [Chitinispirillales bacterium]
IAARLYAEYDKAFAGACLDRAILSYKTLMDTGFVRHTQAPFETGEYGSESDNDKRLWAAAEMWETTGDPEILAYLERNSALSINSGISWASVGTIAALTYLNSARDGKNPETAERLRSRLITVADGLISYAEAHGYARNISLYNWGANGTVAGTAYILHSAYLHTGDEKYRHAIQDVLAHLLGRNHYSRSFVTGVGHNPPQNPHDRTTAASGTPWPGRLIGGPHNSKSGAPASLTQCATSATCWFDVAADYWTNEVAINWNAPLVYALAAAMPGAGALPAPKYPGQPTDGTPARNAYAKKTPAAKRLTTRAVRVQNGRLDIPAGAKVYGLDGKLIAQRKAGDAKAPLIRKNGVFIIRIDETPKK